MKKSIFPTINYNIFNIFIFYTIFIHNIKIQLKQLKNIFEILILQYPLAKFAKMM